MRGMHVRGLMSNNGLALARLHPAKRQWGSFVPRKAWNVLIAASGV